MTRMRTLALIGFDHDEEVAVRGLFGTLKPEGWTLSDEGNAGALLIDVDSMYGQMAWLKSQDDPRPIAALTAAGRADTDFILRRPVSAQGLAEVLEQLAVHTGQREVAESALAEVPIETPEAPEAAAPPAREPTRLIDYLHPGDFSLPVALREAEPPLAIDPVGGTWVGPSSMKALLPHAQRRVAPEDWEPIGAEGYRKLQAELGAPQPLARLRWLAALAGYDGELCPELASAQRFKLGKWVQSEREFPRHFRIATALFKQPATLAELAQASGASGAEVADYINACHTLGLIEAELPAAATPPAEPAPKGGGLLSRLRGRT